MSMNGSLLVLAAAGALAVIGCSPDGAQQSPAAAAQPPSFATGDADSRCTALARLALPKTRITSAEAVRPAPSWSAPATDWDRGGPTFVKRPFCRVAAVVEPAIRFEVWLPLDAWNGRFRGFGLGAFFGAIRYPAMAPSLEAGYAVASTDTGHQSGGSDPKWVLTDAGFQQGLFEDWAHRGIHEMTVQGKAIAAAFYGRAPEHAYFDGCSSGGHQALTEAQRYPTDYDGILAGAPANYWTHLQAAQIGYGLATMVDPKSTLQAADIALIHGAVLAQCDALDGVKDDLVENPRRCEFDPQTLACGKGRSEQCLAPAQVAGLEKLYAPFVSGKGEKIYAGFPFGSERDWRGMNDSQVSFAENFYRYMVFHDPAWSYATLDVDKDVAYADRTIGPAVNSVDPNLRPFRDRGGKLIQYHGWGDWGITANGSVDYYESVVAEVGGAAGGAAALAATQEFYRLFMVPGMGHCAGGPGVTDKFDGQGALERWVEQGVAPTQIDAANVVEGRTIRTRPLCPFPQQARWTGSGSTDDAANFECVALE